MSDGPKLIQADDLKGLAARMLEAKGVPHEDALTIADVLVWANLRGVNSHGIARLVPTLEWIDKGIINPAPKIKTDKPRPAILTLDSDRAAGPVAMCLAARLAIDTAKQMGICWASVGLTTHIAAIGYYVEKIAKSGLIGIGICAGMPNMAYAGAKGKGVATSPLSIAVPSNDGVALLDMATAKIALGRIRQFKARGETLPEGTALTEEGEPTTDPELAAIPTPMGGAKGSGMSLMFELLTGVLSGNPVLAPFHANAEGAKKHKQNAALIVLDPAAFGDLDEFKVDVGAALAAIKALPRVDAGIEVMLPGERGAREAAKRMVDGLSLQPKLWTGIEAAAGELGVSID